MSVANPFLIITATHVVVKTDTNQDTKWLGIVVLF